MAKKWAPRRGAKCCGTKKTAFTFDESENITRVDIITTHATIDLVKFYTPEKATKPFGRKDRGQRFKIEQPGCRLAWLSGYAPDPDINGPIRNIKFNWLC